MPIIQVGDITFHIGKNPILTKITFTVKEGEYISIIGPNGSGKTTLLRCLDRIYHVHKGSIHIHGHPIMAYKQKNLARMIGYVPQTMSPSFPYTVFEFVLMGRYPYLNPFHPPQKTDHEAVLDVLRLTGTEDFAHRALNTLSGGERQKVFIAAALVQGSKILLLDEPTTFLDPKHQEEIQDILLRVNRKSGMTIIAATHDINGALRTSHRILALKKGRIIFYGHSESLISNGLLDHIYDKSFTYMRHPQSGKPVVL